MTVWRVEQKIKAAEEEEAVGVGGLQQGMRQMVVEGSGCLASPLLVLQHRLRLDRWKDVHKCVCVCVSGCRGGAGMCAHTHTRRLLGSGGSVQTSSDAVPATPCSRTFSIDLAIKAGGRRREEEGNID